MELVIQAPRLLVPDMLKGIAKYKKLRQTLAKVGGCSGRGWRESSSKQRCSQAGTSCRDSPSPQSSQRNFSRREGTARKKNLLKKRKEKMKLLKRKK